MLKGFLDWQSIEGYRRLKVVLLVVLISAVGVAYKKRKPPIDITLESNDIQIHQSLLVSGHAPAEHEVVIEQRSTETKEFKTLASIHADAKGEYTVSILPDIEGNSYLVAIDQDGDKTEPAFFYVRPEGSAGQPLPTL